MWNKNSSLDKLSTLGKHELFQKTIKDFVYGRYLTSWNLGELVPENKDSSSLKCLKKTIQWKAEDYSKQLVSLLWHPLV